jgi:hypothetical protein
VLVSTPADFLEKTLMASFFAALIIPLGVVIVTGCLILAMTLPNPPQKG